VHVCVRVRKLKCRFSAGSKSYIFMHDSYVRIYILVRVHICVRECELDRRPFAGIVCVSVCVCVRMYVYGRVLDYMYA